MIVIAVDHQFNGLGKFLGNSPLFLFLLFQVFFHILVKLITDCLRKECIDECSTLDRSVEHLFLAAFDEPVVRQETEQNEQKYTHNNSRDEIRFICHVFLLHIIAGINAQNVCVVLGVQGHGGIRSVIRTSSFLDILDHIVRNPHTVIFRIMKVTYAQECGFGSIQAKGEGRIICTTFRKTSRILQDANDASDITGENILKQESPVNRRIQASHKVFVWTPSIKNWVCNRSKRIRLKGGSFVPVLSHTQIGRHQVLGGHGRFILCLLGCCSCFRIRQVQGHTSDYGLL